MKPDQHLSYRPDIDGLRAVAILSVVGFHAFPAWFRGGFIGVDIFFLISKTKDLVSQHFTRVVCVVFSRPL